MAKISGFNSIETGSGDIQSGKEYTVAELIDIVRELHRVVEEIKISSGQGIDMEAVGAFLAEIPNIQNHITDTVIHLTLLQKTKLATIMSEYDLGTLGGGGGGGGATIYTTKAALLAAPGEIGAMAIIETEPLNLYIWDPVHNKWAVKDGNIYATANMPNPVDFFIQPGTMLINSDDGSRDIWN